MTRGWYQLLVQPGQEETVKQSLRRRMEEDPGLSAKIFEISIPGEMIEAPGRGLVKRRNYFPNSLFLDMDLDDDSLWAIKSLDHVVKFDGEPNIKPLSEEDVATIQKLLPKKTPLQPGDEAEVIDASSIYKGQIGTVLEIDEAGDKITLALPSDYEPGDAEVVDPSSPFNGKKGTILKMDKDKGTVTLSLAFKNRELSVDFPLNQIKISPKAPSLQPVDLALAQVKPYYLRRQWSPEPQNASPEEPGTPEQ